MKVPLIWLRDYVDIQVPVAELAHRLTDAGIEVEGVESIGTGWDRDRVFVGRIVSIDPHPNADRLTLPTVDYGVEERRVVTGAPNIKVGDRVPFAIEGATLIDTHGDGGPLVLKPTKIRGVESSGMVCSALELGLGEDHEGILILPDDAPVGTPLADYLGGDVIDLDLKPDRSDCLSMIGVARVVAGLFELPLKLPDLGSPRDDRAALPELTIDIRDPELSSRYAAAYLYDLTVADSPHWMQRRLEAAGQRPINNLVDITNFVMLETGQPLHAFDQQKLRGGVIGVRPAEAGETLRTLDGQDRKLSPDDTVIFDGGGAVALAGVMGGLDSEVTETTGDILLEAANFNQTRIRNTSRGMGLRSEASRRFEQRLSAETADYALRRSVRLAEEIGAARGVDLWEDAYPGRTGPVVIDFPLSEVPRLLGIEFPRERVIDALQRAFFEIETDQGDTLRVKVPHWRGDVTMNADLVEEVAVMIGYEAIPSTLPRGGVVGSVVSEVDHRDEIVRDIFAAAGYQEVITYTMSNPERLRQVLGGAGADAIDEAGARAGERFLPVELEPLKLMNPLRAEEDSLRTTALGHVLETLTANLRFADRDVSLFELAKTFIPAGAELPEERRVLTAVVGQQLSSPGWDQRREATFFDLKGLAELLLRRFGIESPTTAPFRHPTFQAGRCATVSAGDTLLAAFGEVSPATRALSDIDETAWALLVDVDALLSMSDHARQFARLPRFPAVIQDISIVVDLNSRAADFVDAIQSAGGDVVESVALVDEYRGDQVPAGKRGLTFSIVYRDAERTLTDDEVAARHARIVRSLEARFGATLRV